VPVIEYGSESFQCHKELNRDLLTVFAKIAMYLVKRLGWGRMSPMFVDERPPNNSLENTPFQRFLMRNMNIIAI
jgi:hypothetical protein